jgi:hypothetical protein
MPPFHHNFELPVGPLRILIGYRDRHLIYQLSITIGQVANGVKTGGKILGPHGEETSVTNVNHMVLERPPGTAKTGFARIGAATLHCGSRWLWVRPSAPSPYRRNFRPTRSTWQPPATAAVDVARWPGFGAFQISTKKSLC